MKGFNTPPSQGGIHGFETRTGYQEENISFVKWVYNKALEIDIPVLLFKINVI